MSASLELPFDFTILGHSTRSHVPANLRDAESLETVYGVLQALEPIALEAAAGRIPRRHTVEGAYKPSTAKLRDLQPISLRGLVIDTRNTGSMLVVRIWHQPVDLGIITTAVEDTDGSVEVMQVQNCDTRINPSSLALGVFLAVKEPWFINYESRATVRVDHPSDIVLLDTSDPLVQRAFTGTPHVQLTGDASALKGMGDQSFLGKQYGTAEKLYTSGIGACGPQDVALKRDLYRNRSLTRVLLGKFEMACDDAMAALVPIQDDLTAAQRKDNATSYYRHGRASYELGWFEDAQTSFEHACDLNKTSTHEQELRRTRARIAEQDTGMYDLDQIGWTLDQGRYCLDHASFTKFTSMRDTGDERGRGLYAEKAFKTGDLVLCEKVFVASSAEIQPSDKHKYFTTWPSRELSTNHHSIFTAVMGQLSFNPKQAARFFDVARTGFAVNTSAVAQGDRLDCTVLEIVDGAVPLDTFKVHGTLSCNVFDFPLTRSAQESHAVHRDGIWLQTSLINHSCDANCQRSNLGDLMFVRAAKDIAAGEELTIAYIGPQIILTEILTDRQRLMDTWGFRCTCKVCVAEQAGDHELRATMMKQVGTFCKARNPHEAVDSHVIRYVERVYDRILQAYNIPEFQEPIARQCLVEAGMWLLNVYGRQASRVGQATSAQTAKKVITFGNDLLRSSGLGVTFAQEQLRIDYKHWIVHGSVIPAALAIALAHNKRGNKRAAEQYVTFARKVYMIYYNELKGFDETTSLP